MKIILKSLVIGFTVISSACQQSKPTEIKELPRIGIAGLAIESSTFSPALTDEEAFHARTGDAIFAEYPFLSADSLNRKRANWIPTLRGVALPGGIVTREAYESLVTKTLELLKQNGPYDGLFLDIHGAMS
ncbi:MAG TPA: M81 family metallopeptidase, partial [Cyclobacteriaceae bacterium]|nr:M81 family metallopeptidase [Cyclobacteriaceae bacterium]